MPQSDPPAAEPVADAAAPRDRAPKLPRGSWPHVEKRGPCQVAVLPAPPQEKAKRLDDARARLAPLGGTATIQLTTIGDRVERVDWKDTNPASKPPSKDEARELALGFLKRHADLFGVSADELASVRFVSMKVSSVAGIAWEVHGLLARRPELAVQPVRVGGGLILVDLDGAGRIVTAKADRAALPPVTLCTATLPREAIERAVVGRELVWNSSSGPRSEGNVTAADIVGIEHTARALPPQTLEADEPPVIAALYVVSVNRGGTWSLFVDPATAEVSRVEPMFDD